MTRINVVPVSTLTQQHLVAEYRENPRVFALVEKAILRGESPSNRKNPSAYTLGAGHVRFFYNKLAYIADRQMQLVQEMLKRGYNPAFTTDLRVEWESKIPDKQWWESYTPTEEALHMNRERITLRLSGVKS